MGSDELTIKRIITGEWEENCYIINDIHQNAIVIDPGARGIDIIGYIKSNKLHFHAILNTHAHYDHIGAVEELKKEFTVPFYLHSQDLRLLKHANFYVKLFHGAGPVSIPDIDFYLDKMENPLVFEEMIIRIHFTPGHTNGSVCFSINNCLFTGDTIFGGNIGRTDLPGGNKSLLGKSLKIITELPENTVIYPGHGESTILSRELQYNKKFIEALTWE